jgi:hypothetical protein
VPTEYEPADMVTLLQLQDAVANAKLVEKRVAAVGRRIMGLAPEVEGDRERRWTFVSYRLNLKEPPQGMDHLSETAVSATFRTEWHSRPVTAKYGDPEDDPCSEYEASNEFLTRRVTFPYRYLITEGWEDEVLQKNARWQAWLLDSRLEQRERRLAERESEIAAARAELEADKLLNERNRAAGLLEQKNA